MSRSISDEQRMLVQWCMSSRLFAESALREAIRRIYSIEDDEEGSSDSIDIQQTIDVVNSSISLFSLELRSGMDQRTGDRKWAIVNTNADAISTAATPYSPVELGILKALIEGIFTAESGNYALRLHDALRTAAQRGPSGFSRSDSDTLIKRFCGDGWLELVSSQWLVLGMRAAVELQTYFNDGFSDYIRECSLCKEMATCGMVCPGCRASIHPYCAERVSSTSDSNTLSCPSCHQHVRQPLRFGPGEQGVPFGAGQDAEQGAGQSAGLSPKRQRLELEYTDDEE